MHSNFRDDEIIVGMEYLSLLYENLPDVPEGIKQISSKFLAGLPISRCPKLPSTLLRIDSRFLYKTRIREPPVIPLSVMSIGYSFLKDCYTLKEPPYIHEHVEIAYGFLFGCHGIFVTILKWNKGTYSDDSDYFEYENEEGYWGSNIMDTDGLAREYWKRKQTVSHRVLLSVLEIPEHILKDTILTKLILA